MNVVHASCLLFRHPPLRRNDDGSLHSTRVSVLDFYTVPPEALWHANSRLK